MTEIFKSLIGMTFIVGLFLVFEALIQFHVPDLGLIASFVRGFVYVILFMAKLSQLWQRRKNCRL